MLQLFSRAKTWYMGGTFKVVRAQFTQLYSIHAFLQKEGDTKQVRLLFALISSRKKRDYKAVLRSVLQLLSGGPSVKGLVMDFEMSIWKAAESVLPEDDRKRYALHWVNAVVWDCFQPTTKDSLLFCSYQKSIYQLCFKNWTGMLLQANWGC